MSPNYIRTFTGQSLTFLNPHPDQINLYDIAIGMSRQPRFTGQTSKDYSVLHHTLNVVRITPHEFQKEALLHDATEAYLCDMPAPIKAYLPDYRALEARLDDTIRLKYNLPLAKSDAVREADHKIFSREAYVFMTLIQPDWGVDPTQKDLPLSIVHNPIEEFMMWAEELGV